MKSYSFRPIILTAAMGFVVACNLSATACTGIRVKPQDGSIIVARTLEFATVLQSNVIVIPRAMESVGTAPGDKPGLRWRSNYAVVGANMLDVPAILDGINEKGLAVATFYFPEYAKYPEIQEDALDKTIAQWELPRYLLGQCAEVEQVVQTVGDIRVGNVFLKAMGMAPPLHYLVTDASGKCVVLEYVSGGLKIHNNPLGVLTNAPTFDWHVTNLCNYINLSPDSAPPMDIAGMVFRALGQGSGMLGLPGDFTPPSRFVRAVAFSRSALPVATAREGVLTAFHILNQFDIPKGAARSSEDGQPTEDYTQWTSASDLTNRRYYFRTYDSSQIRMVDLNAMDLDAKAIKTISMSGQETIEDLSGEAR